MSKRIITVIPTLNEERAIGNVIKGLKAQLRWDHEILVVDGHSTDRTVELAKSAGAKVIFQKGRGYGDAYLSGFEYALQNLDPDIILMIDGDGTYDPLDVAIILEPLLKGKADLVIGNRFPHMDPGAMNPLNIVGNKILSWIARRLTRIHIYDTQCGLRALTASLLRKMYLTSTGMPLAIEMLVEAKEIGARIVEVPVRYHPRIGESKLRPIRDGLRIAATILRLARDCEPIMFFGLISLGFIVAGTIIGLKVVLEWLSTGRIGHLASTVLSALLIITGVQMFVLGLLADMIRGLRRKILHRKLE